MRIIVGLGNPGSKHAGQRHNIGFMAVDEIFRRHSFSPWRKKFKGEIADGEIAGEKILLVKPQTFMNLSGECVGEIMRFYKLTPADISVFYDELDLASGKVRIKIGGGHGGHNGIKSIDAHCGKDYKRVRMGIDHPGHKDRVHSHVLGDFAKKDGEWLEPLLDELARNIDLFIKGDDSSFMNKLALAIGDKPAQNAATTKQQKPNKSTQKSKAKSHIHQARTQNKPEPPQTGPMADMLKKLFGKKDT